MEPATDDDVVLRIYELLPTEEQRQVANGSAPSAAGFFSRILTPLGFGAYHTSVQLHGYCYTFAAHSGITKYKAETPTTTLDARHVPRGGNYKESIVLGSTEYRRGEINEIINRLGAKCFTPTSYHLLNRNCNHFSEVLAMALLLGDRLVDAETCPKKLDTFPTWVNRFAKTGTAMGLDDGITRCDVFEEARIGVGTEGKVGRTLTSTTADANGNKGKGGKKELTEKQKAALAKLKKGGK